MLQQPDRWCPISGQCGCPCSYPLGPTVYESKLRLSSSSVRTSIREWHSHSLRLAHPRTPPIGLYRLSQRGLPPTRLCHASGPSLSDGTRLSNLTSSCCISQPALLSYGRHAPLLRLFLPLPLYLRCFPRRSFVVPPLLLFLTQSWAERDPSGSLLPSVMYSSLFAPTYRPRRHVFPLRFPSHPF